MAFGATWFAFVALAQLRLTEIEGEWSSGFALLALGGGLTFVAAATLAGGTAPARGTISLDEEALRARRLVFAALVLLVAGVAGAAYKADVLGGIPLLSENPDRVRGRAFFGGDTALPAWSSALTGGFYLSMWCTLTALWVLRGRTTKPRAALLWALAAAALFGVSLEASRNLIAFAVAVPAIGAYLLARPRGSRSQLAWVAVGLGVAALAMGGLFALRLARGDGAARAYVELEAERQPAAVKPLVPAYVNGVLPLEAARRMYESLPERFSYGRGADSLTSLPDRAFPEGKAKYGNKVALLMGLGQRQDAQITWSVASYQGRLLADLGWRGVMLGSALLGLLFGSLHRWARARRGLLPVAVVAFAAYYSAYMLYDNQLSFSLIAGFDLAVLALVGAFASGRLGRRPA